MPKILMLLRGNIVTDARVSKEIETLRRAGYDVALAELLASERSAAPTADEFDFVTIPLWTNILPRSYLTLPVKLVEMTLRMIWIAVRQKPDLIHCHDLEPLLAAAVAAWLLRIPFIYDSHEIQSERPTMTKPKWFWLRVERLLARRAACVIVTDRYRRKIIGDLLRLPEDKLQVVMNLPLRRSLRSHGPTIREQIAKDTQIGLYMGGLIKHRHLEDLIDSVALLPEDYVLALVGPGEDTYRQELEARAEQLNVASRVVFVPPKPWSELIHFISTADCTFAFYHSRFLNNHYCSPNKLFDSLVAGVPVVATANPLIVDIAQETGAGVCIKDVTAEAIAEAVRRLLPEWDDPKKRRELASMAQDRYVWESQEEEFVARYRKILPVEKSGKLENAATRSI